MNELKIFENEEFGKMRIVELNNEPWFVGKDVAEILGYSNPNEAIQDHIDDEDKLNSKTLSSFELNLGQRGGWIINESGLYSLILSSKLPTAKRFKHWVTSEVLPSIRKHDAYLTPQKIEEILLNPDTIIELATNLKEERKRVELLKADLAIAQPKADYFDEIVDRNLLTNLRDTAKELKVKQTVFINFLLENKYLYRDKRNKLMPYADKNDGLFEVKEYYDEKSGHCGVQTLVTPKGRETFRLLLKTYIKSTDENEVA